MPEHQGSGRTPKLFSRFTLIHGGQEPDVRQMVAVDPAAGTPEDGQTDTDVCHVGVEELEQRSDGPRMAPLPTGQERST